MESNLDRLEDHDDLPRPIPDVSEVDRLDELFVASLDEVVTNRNAPSRPGSVRKSKSGPPNRFRTLRRLRRVAAYAVTLVLVVGNFYFLVLRPEGNWWFVKHPFDGPFLRAKTLEAAPDIDAALVVEKRSLEGEVASAIELLSKDELHFYRMHIGGAGKRYRFCFEVWRDQALLQEQSLCELFGAGKTTLEAVVAAPKSVPEGSNLRIPFRIARTRAVTNEPIAGGRVETTASTISGDIIPNPEKTGPIDVSGVRSFRTLEKVTQRDASPSTRVEFLSLFYNRTEIRVILEVEFESKADK